MGINFDFKFGDPRERNNWELLYPLMGSVPLILLEYFLKKTIFKQLGIRLGLARIRIKKAPSNPILEAAYHKSKKWNPQQIVGFSKQLDMAENDVKQWLELKIAENKPKVLEKFCLSSWKLFYFICEFLLGLWVLWGKPWLWDLNACWNDFFDPTLTKDVWWYFMFWSASLWGQLFTLFFQTKKKDFYVLLIHHVVTISLSILCFESNLIRGIMMIVFVSDIPDIFVEASKLAKCLGNEKVTLFSFLIFSISWIVVRLYAHPFWIMKSFVVDAPRILPTFDTYITYYAFSVILISFVILNFIWTAFLVKAAVNIFRTGTVKDTLSNDEDE